KSRQLIQQRRLAEQQGEAKQREALVTKLQEKQAQLALLAIRAPCSGQILNRKLAALEGTYVEAGQVLLAIGDERKKELHISIAQEDVNVFSERIGGLLRIDLPGDPL